MITTGARLARYRIGPQVAHGPKARIFLAESSYEPRRACLVKVLRSDLRDPAPSRSLLLEEGAMLRRLAHPAIEALLEIDSASDELFYAIHLSEGVTLRELQSTIAPSAWTKRAILELAITIFDALTFSHALGESHGSLTADNVRISHTGRTTLWGFGLPELACYSPHEESHELNPCDRFARDVFAAGRLLRAILVSSSVKVPRDLAALIRATVEPSPRCRPQALEALSILRSISTWEDAPLLALLGQRQTPGPNEKTMVLRAPRRIAAPEAPTLIMKSPDPDLDRSRSVGPGLITAVILCGLLLGFLLTNGLPLV